GPGTGHQGFPLVNAEQELVGVLTRRDIVGSAAPDPVATRTLVLRSPISVRPEASLREAADLMVTEKVGRLPVVVEGKVVGIVTRSDLLNVHQRRLIGET